MIQSQVQSIGRFMMKNIRVYNKEKLKKVAKIDSKDFQFKKHSQRATKNIELANVTTIKLMGIRKLKISFSDQATGFFHFLHENKIEVDKNNPKIIVLRAKHLDEKDNLVLPNCFESLILNSFIGEIDFKKNTSIKKVSSSGNSIFQIENIFQRYIKIDSEDNSSIKVKNTAIEKLDLNAFSNSSLIFSKSFIFELNSIIDHFSVVYLKAISENFIFHCEADVRSVSELRINSFENNILDSKYDVHSTLIIDKHKEENLFHRNSHEFLQHVRHCISRKTYKMPHTHKDSAGQKDLLNYMGLLNGLITEKNNYDDAFFLKMLNAEYSTDFINKDNRDQIIKLLKKADLKQFTKKEIKKIKTLRSLFSIKNESFGVSFLNDD